MTNGSDSHRISGVKEKYAGDDDDLEVIIINVKFKSESFQVDLPQNSLGRDLKCKISSYISLSPHEMRLIHRGRILHDDQLVSFLSKPYAHV